MWSFCETVRCSFDTTSVVDNFLDFWFKRYRVYLVFWSKAGISPFCKELGTQRPQRVIMRLSGPDPLVLPWWFIFLVMFLPSVPFPAGFCHGRSSALFLMWTFLLLCFFSLRDSTCFYSFKIFILFFSFLLESKRSLASPLHLRCLKPNFFPSQIVALFPSWILILLRSRGLGLEVILEFPSPICPLATGN